MPPAPKSKSYKDRFVGHIKQHKVIYSIGGVVVIAGISYYIGTRIGVPRILSPTASIFGINNKLDQRVTTLVDRKGPPSWIIGRVGSNEEWLSQESAAIAEGLRLRDLRDHLNGRLESVNGERYFRKGLAAA